MRNIKIIFLLSILLIIYIYVANITLFPKTIILMQGEKINLARFLGISIKENENSNPNLDNFMEETIVKASTDIGIDKTEKVGKIDLSLNIFNNIPLKEVSVNILPKVKVIPLGNAIGLKLYTEGVLIVGKSEINGIKPYSTTNLKEGDRIISINDEKIDSTEELIETINKSRGREINVKYVSNGEEEETSIIPVEDKDNEYKIGLWVRDASAGVGTATFYIPSSKEFMCLGHGISDIDTEKLITIASGELVTTDIVSIQKGTKGKPRRDKRFNRRLK